MTSTMNSVKINNIYEKINNINFLIINNNTKCNRIIKRK